METLEVTLSRSASETDAHAPPKSGPKSGPKRYQLLFNADEAALVERVKESMRGTKRDHDTFRRSLEFTDWILTLEREGYKLAMVKDDEVLALKFFL